MALDFATMSDAAVTPPEAALAQAESALVDDIKRHGENAYYYAHRRNIGPTSIRAYDEPVSGCETVSLRGFVRIDWAGHRPIPTRPPHRFLPRPKTPNPPRTALPHRSPGCSRRLLELAPLQLELHRLPW